MIDLDELERLAKAATPGPWCNDYEDIFKWTFMLTKKPIATAELPGNARYIVAACNAVPELIARVRELERQRKWLATFIEANVDCEQCPYHEDICRPQAPVDCYEFIVKKAKEDEE